MEEGLKMEEGLLSGAADDDCGDKFYDIAGCGMNNVAQLGVGFESPKKKGPDEAETEVHLQEWRAEASPIDLPVMTFSAEAEPALSPYDSVEGGHRHLVRGLPTVWWVWWRVLSDCDCGFALLPYCLIPVLDHC